LYAVFRRVGKALYVRALPASYAGWQQDREHHLCRDLAYSEYSARLFGQYRKHLGAWRYGLLLRVQALLVPHQVRNLLHANPPKLRAQLASTYGVMKRLKLQPLVRRILVQPRYWREVQMLDRGVTD